MYIDPLFQTYDLNQDGKIRVARIKETFNDCIVELKDICPENTREFALVATKLQEACMFAVRCISVISQYQAR